MSGKLVSDMYDIKSSLYEMKKKILGVEKALFLL